MNHKKYNRKKVRIYYLALIPLLSILYPISELTKSTYMIFPASDLANRISALDDKNWNGNSHIDKFIFDEHTLQLQYTLKEGAAIPLVFYTLYLSHPEKGLDLSHYTSLSLRIKDASIKNVTIFIKTFLPGISLTDSKNAHTLRHNQFILQLHPGKRHYDIPLKDFLTPDWWLEMMQTDTTKIPIESFSKVVTFDMQFNPFSFDTVINKPEHITIENITFRKELPLVGILLCWFTGVYACVYIILLFVNLLKKKQHELPQQKEIEVTSYRDDAIQRIKVFIESNYCNEQISTQLMYKTLGIPPARIFGLIKDKYDMTFKQLINKMRSTEAKRLLKDTDLRIVDIAFRLGFNNVSYFNRLFKESEGVTPSDYRKQER